MVVLTVRASVVVIGLEQNLLVRKVSIYMYTIVGKVHAYLSQQTILLYLWQNVKFSLVTD